MASLSTLTALCSGVSPRSSKHFTSAPDLRSSSTMVTCLPRIALCSGVLPNVSFALTSAQGMNDKNCKLLMTKMIMTRQGRSMRRGRKGGVPPTPVFCLKKSKHARIKVDNKNSSPRAHNDVYQARWNFSGFKIQRPVQGVLLTQSPLLFKYNDYELPKIFVPPSPPPALAPLQVSKGLLRLCEGKGSESC